MLPICHHGPPEFLAKVTQDMTQRRLIYANICKLANDKAKKDIYIYMPFFGNLLSEYIIYCSVIIVKVLFIH